VRPFFAEPFSQYYIVAIVSNKNTAMTNPVSVGAEIARFRLGPEIEPVKKRAPTNHANFPILLRQ
jgi:hypothetical protein